VDLSVAFLEAVPFARTLGISIVEIVTDGDIRAVAELADRPDLHNHVGGPHAGVLYSLGETASGAVTMAAFGDQLGRAVPLAVRATIEYRRLAMGGLRATARLGRPVADVLAELDGGVRPEFDVVVELATTDGTVVAELTVVWTLRPHR
jgi:acyl-coenzyme A thioesterase PaaI-like protein